MDRCPYIYVYKLRQRSLIVPENDILEKTSGTFMWVILAVAMLNQAYDCGKVEAMHQTLRKVSCICGGLTSQSELFISLYLRFDALADMWDGLL